MLTLNAGYDALKEWLRFWESLWLGIRSDVFSKLKLIHFDNRLTLNTGYDALKDWLRFWENVWLGDRTDVFNKLKLSCLCMCAHTHTLIVPGV